MQTMVVPVSSKHRVVIPKAIRETLGIGPKDSLLFVVDGGTIVVRTWPSSLTTALRGLHAELWPTLGGWMDERW